MFYCERSQFLTFSLSSQTNGGIVEQHSVAIILTLGMWGVGGTRWRSWLRHCTTSRKVAVSIPDGVTGIFL